MSDDREREYQDLNIALLSLEEARDHIGRADRALRIALGLSGYDRSALDHLEAARSEAGRLQVALKKEVEARA